MRSKPVYLFDPEVSQSAIDRKGEIPWLKKVGFLVPKGSLRIREGDVMNPKELAQVNLQYKNRYLYGPSWRADIITAIESGLNSPAAIVARVGCSYEPAHRVLREWKVATAAWSGSSQKRDSALFSATKEDLQNWKAMNQIISC